MIWHLFILVVTAYLVGSVPVAALLSRTQDIDIFQIGTGNPGAANVFRSVSRHLGLAVFALDATKGCAPVVAARLWQLPEELLPIVGAAAVAGHWNPVFLRFRGGVGLATAIGVGVTLMPLPGAFGLGIGALALGVTQSVEYGSGIGYAASVAASAWFRPGWVPPIGAGALAVLVWAHRELVRTYLRRNTMPA